MGWVQQTLSSYVGVSTTRAQALLRSHRETFPQFWRWSAAIQDAAIATGELLTVFGWRMRVLPNVKSGTLSNYPMQSNGGEMLRLACIFAVDRGIPIVAPIHDALLVEGPAKDIDDIMTEMAKCMVEASRVVLGGPTVRADQDPPLHFPNRYVDGRDGSSELWGTTIRLLTKLTARKVA